MSESAPLPQPADRVAVTPDGRRITYTVTGPEGALPVVVHHGTPGSAHATQEWLRATAPARPAAGDLRARRLRRLRPARRAQRGRRGRRRRGDPRRDRRRRLHQRGTLRRRAAHPGVRRPAAGPGPGRRLRGGGRAAFSRRQRRAGARRVARRDGRGERGGVQRGRWRAKPPSGRSWRPSCPACAAPSATPSSRRWPTLLPPVDLKALSGQFAQDTVTSFARGLAPGVDGWIDDDFAYGKAWGFDLDAIKVPVAIWQGSADLMVPFAHGQWLAAAAARRRRAPAGGRGPPLARHRRSERHPRAPAAHRRALTAR